jgi:hypothetical protein
LIKKYFKGMSKSELTFFTARLCKSRFRYERSPNSEIASSSDKDDVRKLQHDA